MVVMMDQQLLANVCKQVYRRFPEVSGVMPKVQSRPEGNLLLVFSGMGKGADGCAIPRTIRVVVSSTGKVIRMTTSR